jgi:hypothetical protein
LIVPEVPPVEFEHALALRAMVSQAWRKFVQLPEQDALHMPVLPRVQSELQSGVQLPPEQVVPVPHTWPQVPQLLLSVFVFTSHVAWLLQFAVPAEQLVQLPPEQKEEVPQEVQLALPHGGVQSLHIPPLHVLLHVTEPVE